jgi:hypothetical protein
MKGVPFLLAACLVVLAGCTDSSSDNGTSDVPVTSTTSTPAATSPPAPTNCREAPQLPACREGHEEGS